MGIREPLDKFRHLPEWIHGVAIEIYYGGRSEVRIRGVELPTILVDYTSNYPTAAALLNVWRLMIAKTICIRDVTAQARKVLNSVSGQDYCGLLAQYHRTALVGLPHNPNCDASFIDSGFECRDRTPIPRSSQRLETTGLLESVPLLKSFFGG